MQKPFQVTTAMLDELSENIESQMPKPDWAPKQQTEALLDTRQQTHGDFRTNSHVSQHLKATFRALPHWEHLDVVEKEVLDMIALKFSRILSGKSLEAQHWEDVAGYAQLALRECPGSRGD